MVLLQFDTIAYLTNSKNVMSVLLCQIPKKMNIAQTFSFSENVSGRASLIGTTTEAATLRPFLAKFAS